MTLNAKAYPVQEDTDRHDIYGYQISVWKAYNPFRTKQRLEPYSYATEEQAQKRCDKINRQIKEKFDIKL